MPVTEVRQHVSFVKLPEEACTAAMAGHEPLYFLESFIPPTDRRLDVSC